MGNLFAELKRRHIYRVAAAYAVVAWVLLQIFNNLEPLLKLPDWAGTLVLVLLLGGFPVALMFAWIHQLTPAPAADEPKIKDEKDLQQYEKIFDDVDCWKKIGEEYQQPLIVTGSVLFQEISRSGPQSSVQEYMAPDGRRATQEVRTFVDRKGYALIPKFVFIDGRTGAQLYSEGAREEVLYPSTQNTPALSAYFELMDKLLPGFLNTLSTQKIKGTRILLK